MKFSKILLDVWRRLHSVTVGADACSGASSSTATNERAQRSFSVGPRILALILTFVSMIAGASAVQAQNATIYPTISTLTPHHDGSGAFIATVTVDYYRGYPLTGYDTATLTATHADSSTPAQVVRQSASPLPTRVEGVNWYPFVYTFLVTPNENEDIQLNFAANQLSESIPQQGPVNAYIANNLAATQKVVPYLNEAMYPAPSVSITAPADHAGSEFTATVTFSESVTGLTASDFVLTNVNFVNLSGSGTTYSVQILPASATTDVTIKLPESIVVSDAGNMPNSASNVVTVTAQVVQPPSPVTTVISGVPAEHDGSTPFTATVTFSEPVTGFDAADVVITGGTVTAVSGGPDVYTLSITPTGTEAVTLSVREAGAQSLATGADNGASNVVTVAHMVTEDVPVVDAAPITKDKISTFMLERSSRVAAQQPGLIRFMRGHPCGKLDASANDTNATLEGCINHGNVWSEVNGSWNDDSSFVMGTVGVHILTQQNYMVGAMAQFDRFTYDPLGAESTGWMVGPYFIAKHPDQPIFYEGRLLYGQADNEITPFGTYTDSFDSERFLAQLKVQGEYVKDQMTYLPYLDVTATDDRQKSYTDSEGNFISDTTVNLTQVMFGLDVERNVAVEKGTMRLLGGFRGIYADTDDANVRFDTLRGRLDLGLVYNANELNTFEVKAFQDGVFTDYAATGVAITFDRRF